VIVDTANFGVGSYVLKTTITPIRTAGQVCDPTGVASRCDTGLICLGDNTCGAPSAPLFTALQALRLDADRIRLVVDGQDVDGDARGIEYQRRNSGGTLLDASAVFAFFSPPVSGSASPFVSALVLTGQTGADVASVEVRIRDDQGLLSAPRTENVVAIPVRASGQVCDLARLRDQCATGTECRDGGGGSGTCQPIDGFDCNDPIDLNALATLASGVWHYAGDTTNGQAAVDPACLAGTGIEKVHVYRPAVRSDLIISTRNPGTTFNTVLYYRLFCGVSGSDACNDDFGGSLQSEIVAANIPANFPIFVFVDGSDALRFGPYELTIREKPLLAEGEACDAAGVQNGCQSGLTCVQGAAGGGHICARPLVINEVYYDDPGADDQYFTEIHGTAGMVLDGYSLVGVNGSDDSTYATLSLNGAVVPADGLLVIGASGVTNVDVVSTTADWQNGPDAIQLRNPAGATLDAVGYGTGATTFRGEGSPAPDPADTQSISRNTSHSDTQDNAVDFTATTPSPGTP
jgi:hypothetical protein